MIRPARLGVLSALAALGLALGFLGSPSGASAAPEAPSTLEEQPGQWTPLDRLESDFRDYPNLRGGGWDVYVDVQDDVPTGFAASLVFAGLGEFIYLGQLTDPDTGRVISNFAVFWGTYATADSRPGWSSWTVRGLEGETLAMNARFLSPDVAIMEIRATPSATRVQRLLLVRTACDFRYSGDNSEEIEGCKWLPLTGEILRDAYLSGECAMGPCYALVSDCYYLYAH